MSSGHYAKGAVDRLSAVREALAMLRHAGFLIVAPLSSVLADWAQAAVDVTASPHLTIIGADPAACLRLGDLVQLAGSQNGTGLTPARTFELVVTPQRISHKLGC